jgi:hypothetical protein
MTDRRDPIPPVLAPPEPPMQRAAVPEDLAQHIARTYGAAVAPDASVTRWRQGAMATAETIPRAAALRMGWRVFLRHAAHRRAAQRRGEA